MLFFALAGIAMALPWLGDLAAFRANAQDLVARDRPPVFFPTVHTLSSYWSIVWTGTRCAWLARIPGTVAAGSFVLSLALWVSHRMYRCPEGRRLVYPYLLWLAALATFLPPISNDYNLFFLPLAAVAVWDRRDPVVVHLLMALLLLWWQPLLLPIGPNLLFAFKLLGFLGVTLSLLKRIGEQNEVHLLQQFGILARAG
jgi:hypothetical protein